MWTQRHIVATFKVENIARQHVKLRRNLSTRLDHWSPGKRFIPCSLISRSGLLATAWTCSWAFRPGKRLSSAGSQYELLVCLFRIRVLTTSYYYYLVRTSAPHPRKDGPKLIQNWFTLVHKNTSSWGSMKIRREYTKSTADPWGCGINKIIY